MAHLGEVLTLDCHEVRVDPRRSYPMVGLRSFGKGLFHRPEVLGAESSYAKLYRLERDQIVLSRLFGWEGAVAQVTEEYVGLFVSPEFPTFTVDVTRIDPSYVGHFVRWADFHSLLAGGTRGLGQRRQRVHPDALLKIEIPLPPMEEQRACARRLDLARWSATSTSQALESRGATRITESLPNFVDAILQEKASSWTTVDDVAEFVADTVHPGEDPFPADRFVGLQHLERNTGRSIGYEALGLMKGRKFRFQPGDVLYGYLRPYLNKVWVSDSHGLCSVDQYVLRPRANVSSELLGHMLRGRRVLDLAIEQTHSLQLPRLRSGLLGQLPVPVVPGDAADSTLARLNGVRDLAVLLRARREHQVDVTDALVPSALNAVFGSVT